MRRYQLGFTLIELMATITVLAIVIGFAAPSFQTIMQNNRVISVSEELSSAMSLARTEAVRRGGRVAICPSSDGASCGGSWEQGFIVVVDAAAGDSAGAVTVDSVLRVWQAPENMPTRISNGPNFVRFLSSGLVFSSSALPLTISIDYEGCGGDRVRNLAVSVSGAISVSKAACSN
jgi:type IV fimbrial biogenesis protein FimT